MKVLTQISTIVMVGILTTASGCASTSNNKDTSPPKHESTGQYLDDTVITTKVKAAILNESTLKSAEINVETYKGVVQLSGFVNSAEDIDKAIEVARGVKGVASVKNDMRLKMK